MSDSVLKKDALQEGFPEPNLKDHSGYSSIPSVVLSFQAELVDKHKPMEDSSFCL